MEVQDRKPSKSTSTLRGWLCFPGHQMHSAESLSNQLSPETSSGSISGIHRRTHVRTAVVNSNLPNKRSKVYRRSKFRPSFPCRVVCQDLSLQQHEDAKHLTAGGSPSEGQREWMMGSERRQSDCSPSIQVNAVATQQCDDDVTFGVGCA